MCKYSCKFSSWKCPYESLEDEEYCVFHLQDDNKDKNLFNQGIENILSAKKDVIRFNGFYFPSGTSNSDAIKAMIINGLGFIGQRLYLFPEFYEKLPVERLIKEGIKPSDLNEHVFGRTLDAIYEYGPTELFNEIVLQYRLLIPKIPSQAPRDLQPHMLLTVGKLSYFYQ